MFVVWSVITIISFGVILFSFFADKQTVLNNSLTCVSKSKFNTECSLCGMTRAFIEIANGNISNAISFNKGSVPLYFVVLLNFIVYIYYFIFRVKSTKIIEAQLIKKYNQI